LFTEINWKIGLFEYQRKLGEWYERVILQLTVYEDGSKGKYVSVKIDININAANIKDLEWCFKHLPEIVTEHRQVAEPFNMHDLIGFNN
jgi:hypothetical protein